jgi:hypothetical protein
LVVNAAGRVRLEVDGRTLIAKPPTEMTVQAASPVAIQPGRHLVYLEFERAGGRPSLTMLWSDESGSYEPIPGAAMSPQPIPEWQRRVRPLVPFALAACCVAWLVMLASGCWLFARRWDSSAVRDWSRPEAAVVAGAAVVFALGIWWGWPGPGWAPDELDPGAVREAIRSRFSGGWFDKYPPGLYWLLTIAFAPSLVAEQFHRVSPDGTNVFAILYLQSRIVSLVFAIGTVLAMMALAARLLGSRYAWPAAVGTLAVLPLAYYAKTANVEMASLCFSSWALVFLARWLAECRRRDLVAAALAAGLAVATKDSAYALFVLPSAYVVYTSRKRLGDLVPAALAGLTAFALVHNMAFNWSGFLYHLQEITGPTSADYREYGATLRDQALLFAVACRQFIEMLGLPGLLALGLGAIAVARRIATPPPWLFLAAVSYYLGFIAIIGYSYDRFLLPAMPPFVLIMAIGLRAAFDRRIRFGVPAGAVVVVLIVARVAWLDALMIFDSRYAVERLLHEVVPVEASVGPYGPALYMPRLADFRQIAVPPRVAAIGEGSPDFIVLNVQYAARFRDDPAQRAWMAWLDSGGAYEEILRHRTTFPGPWSLVGMWLGPDLDDSYSNLGKINPEMVVYRRIRE